MMHTVSIETLKGKWAKIAKLSDESWAIENAKRLQALGHCARVQTADGTVLYFYAEGAEADHATS